MAYTPPSGHAINFSLESYTPPSGDAVNFDFSSGVSTAVQAITGEVVVEGLLASTLRPDSYNVAITGEVVIEGLLASISTEINATVAAIVGEIVVEGLLASTDKAWTWDSYRVAIKDSTRQISAKVEIDFPEGTVTLDDEDIVSMTLLEEVSDSDRNPLGYITSNQLSLVLSNEDYIFTPSNADKLYTVKPGLEIRPYILVYIDWAEEWAEVSLGTFWSGDWDTPSDSVKASTTAHDRLKDILNIDTPQIPVMVDTTVAEMFGRLFRALGLEYDDYIISPSLTQEIQAGWWKRDTVRNSLQTLAEAGNCFVSVNRDNQIVVRPNSYAGDSVDTFTDDDMIFSVNNPQRIGDIYTAVKVQYRVPNLGEEKQLLKVDDIDVSVGGETLDRLDFHDEDLPIMQVNFVYLYGKDIQVEIWDLYLGSATGGTFTLTDGVTTTAAIAYDATAQDIEDALALLYDTEYSSNDVTVTGADGEFVITFNAAVQESDLDASFTNLTAAVLPVLRLRQEYVGPLQSEISDIYFGATDILLDIDHTGTIDEEVDIEVQGVGSGHHIGHSVIEDATAVIDYGHKEFSCINHLIQTQALAKTYSALLLETLSDPFSLFTLETRGDPLLEVGDVLTIKSTINKIPTTNVVVKRQRLQYAGGLRSSIQARRVS